MAANVPLTGCGVKESGQIWADQGCGGGASGQGTVSWVTFASVDAGEKAGRRIADTLADTVTTNEAASLVFRPESTSVSYRKY
jgi:hypothetical protein